MTPPHTCPPPLCTCADGKRPPPSAAVAARIAATMAVAGLAARPALDLLEAGGAGAGAAGRGPLLCRLCPGAAALARTTLIVAAAVTLLAVVALTVRLTTAPPQPPPHAATPARHLPQVVAPADVAARNGRYAAMESTTPVVDEKAVPADAADLGATLPPPVREGASSLDPAADEPTGERAHGETERAAGEVEETEVIMDLLGPPEVGSQAAAHPADSGGEFVPDDVSGVPLDAALADDHSPLLPQGLQQHEADDAADGRHRRPTSAQPRRAYRPRSDHGGGGGGGAAPAWKQFEGCALHLRAVAPAASSPHKRHADRHHALLRAPLPPLHIMAPAAWAVPFPPAQRQFQRFAAPHPGTHPGLHPGPHLPAALWGLHLVPQQQPVWGPATSAAPGPAPGPAPGAAPWEQRVRLYAPGLPCQLCPAPGPVLQLPGGGPAGPAPQGPAWTC
ncbi:Protein Daple [Frankliniella fusca]|uniref:Protein Daple n=1 Tax=Frankliniella fusca TaxID=407009 RepID=A0AAE1H3E7_9NEOP|nr:Protein Daple [Frankliniella fusca]